MLFFYLLFSNQCLCSIKNCKTVSLPLLMSSITLGQDLIISAFLMQLNFLEPWFPSAFFMCIWLILISLICSDIHYIFCCKQEKNAYLFFKVTPIILLYVRQSSYNFLYFLNLLQSFIRSRINHNTVFVYSRLSYFYTYAIAFVFYSKISMILLSSFCVSN